MINTHVLISTIFLFHLFVIFLLSSVIFKTKRLVTVSGASWHRSWIFFWTFFDIRALDIAVGYFWNVDIFDIFWHKSSWHTAVRNVWHFKIFFWHFDTFCTFLTFEFLTYWLSDLLHFDTFWHFLTFIFYLIRISDKAVAYFSTS